MRMAMVAMGVLLGGCGGSLGSIQGFDLGHPEGAGWIKQVDDDSILIAASDLEQNCDTATSFEADANATWTLWVWSTVAATYDEDLPADATVALNDGLLNNETDGTGTIRVNNDKDQLLVDVDLDFGDDRLKGSFKADACDSPAEGSTPATP